MYLDKSFGFETAFAEAVKALSCAHVEAICQNNGIGLIKLMGRESGFIACYAALASQHVNFCLIPEVQFERGSRRYVRKDKYLVGRWHDTFVHIPVILVIGGRRKIDPEGDIWRSVLEATGQPVQMFRNELNQRRTCCHSV
jgi:hypothetical protein